MKLEGNEEIRERALNEFIERLREKLADNLVSAVLFGSCARGDRDESSDLDFLIIVGEYEEIESTLIDTYVGIVLDYGVSIAPIIWNVEDLNANIKYNLIKMDIAGAELSALRGMESLIDQKDRCPIIICEIHPEELRGFGYTDKDLSNFLKRKGLKIKIIGSRDNQHFIKVIS